MSDSTEPLDTAVEVASTVATAREIAGKYSGVQSTPRERGVAWIVAMVFAVLILIPSMLGFVMKFMELIHLSQGDADGGFAITPVVNYLLASAGFFFLLLWAAVNGMFNDLEQPKYLMLENEELLDARN